MALVRDCAYCAQRLPVHMYPPFAEKTMPNGKKTRVPATVCKLCLKKRDLDAATVKRMQLEAEVEALRREQDAYQKRVRDEPGRMAARKLM